MTTEVKIGKVENFHLTVSPEMASPIIDDLQRGADPEVMADLGWHVPEGAQMTLPVETTPEEEADRHEMLAGKSEQDAINANTRQTLLFKLIEEVGDQRRLEGFIVNHESEPENRNAVETKNYRKKDHSNETLARACGSCALAPTCEIRGNIGAWIATHPYAKSDKARRYTGLRYPQVKQTESRMKFAKRLHANAMAHCIPPEPSPKKK